MTYLKKERFKELRNWDVKMFFQKIDVFNENLPLVLFGDFLNKAEIEKIKIQDESEYQILGVRSYGKGTYINRTIKGDTLKMRTYQKAKNNHLFWCKVDTKNGAFGVIDENTKNGVASTNMTFAEINTDLANVNFVQLFFKSVKINRYMDNYVTGTTNRRYIKPNQLLEEIKIPLPTLEEQNRIVSNYNQKTKLANQQQKEAKQLEQEIENYLFEVLGIKKLEQKETKKGLQFVSFKEISRWDVLAEDMRTISSLAKSKYKLQKIGDVFNFDKRSWNKRTYSEQKFNYIELGAINPNFGIKEIKEIEINKAPSRATQQVKTGDLIIGTTRPYLKRFTIIEEKYNDYICSSGFSIITPSSNYNLLFLKEFIISYYGIEQLKNRMTGATYPAITNDELKEILIPLPPLEIQNEIVEYISILKNKIKDLRTQSAYNKALALEEFENELFN